MKTLLSIRTHSFVDLITNSSSELFVCDSSKTVDAVKAVLEKLLNNDAELSGVTRAFEDVFGEIYASPLTFDYPSLPAAIRGEYEKYHDRAGSWSATYMDSDRYQELRDKERDLAAKHKIHESGLYEKDKAEYERRHAAFQPERAALWRDWNRDRFMAEVALEKEVFRINGLPTEEIDQMVEKAKFDQWAFYWKDANSSLAEAWDELRQFLCYGISVEKGDIIVRSACDNSIPWPVMDAIEHYLSARRWHIG